MGRGERRQTESPLIGITKFPDGINLIHDGHHRAVAISLGGRKYLREDEFFVKEYDYRHYTDLEPENNWFTPFDPTTELRVSDFGNYKIEARERYTSDPDSFPSWVKSSKRRFIQPRDISTVAELVEKVKVRLKETTDV